MKIIDRIHAVNKSLSQIAGVKTEFIVSPSMTPDDDLTHFESLIKFRLPVLLKDFYMLEASSASLDWETESPDVFGEDCRRGGFHILSLYDMQETYNDMSEMAKEAENDEMELNANAGLRALVLDWRAWLPIVTFANGDAFCIDMRNDAIVFLEHDVMDGGPYIHGVKIAESFDDLWSKWHDVAFVDIYDWSKGTSDKGLNLSMPIFEKLLVKLTISPSR